MASNWNDYHEGFRDALKVAEAVALELEDRWRRSAAKERERGDRSWFGGIECEKNAKSLEAAADGIKAIRSIISSRKPTQI